MNLMLNFQEWEMLANNAFTEHLTNYDPNSNDSAAWIYYSYKLIVDHQILKWTAVQALEAGLSEKKLTIRDFEDCLLLAHSEQEPNAQAEIVFETDAG